MMIIEEEEKRKLETRLQQDRKLEAIGTLAGGIAHDFNNILMGIQGNASLVLLDMDSDHPHYKRLRNIEQLVQNGAELTGQLLGFAGRGRYKPKPTDLNELIRKSSGMFGHTKKEIKIHRKYRKDIWTVEVDQKQIERVLLNFYVNAWHAISACADGSASRSGSRELYLQTENITLDENCVKPYDIDPGHYVKISVTDTGVGMDETTQQRIFDPYFTTRQMGRGTGLGLASAYGIIRNHGGFINVYSEEGVGTTFNIYLPVSEERVMEEKELAEDILKGSETVLLVDDEDMIIDVSREILNALGYKVLSARSGKEAVEIYESNKDSVDLIILDMVMPGMGGGETYDKLKEINPDIKVLLSSGYSINGQITGVLERGCKAFIQKPFSIKDFSRKIREVLEDG